MKKNKTVKIQYQDYLETYTAHIEKNGDGWVGWIQEVPELKREKDTREELLIHTTNSVTERSLKLFHK